jgi:hypothetical protein
VAALLLCGWTALAAYCSVGMPPAVDLPAHAAQLETLARLVRGDAEVSSVFTLHFVPGYGLVHWLFLPVALAVHGAFAAQLAWFVSLELFAVGMLLLLRLLGRPAWTLLLALPLAFGFSYWYGFLPELFGRGLALLTVAAFCWGLRVGGRRTLALFAALALLTALAHLLVFGLLLAVLLAIALSVAERREALRRLAVGTVLPLAVGLPIALALLRHHPSTLPFSYDGFAHVGWFFRNYRPEGRLAVVLPLVQSLLFAGLYWRRRRLEPAAPFAVLCTLVLLDALGPKTVSDTLTLVCLRLPALVALAALLSADARALPRWLAVALGCLALVSLGETALFHHRFRLAVAGLAEVQQGEPPGRHGYLAADGPRLLGSRLVYLEHTGEWLTARAGGIGQYFFAGAPHLPVAFAPGADFPPALVAFTPAQLLALHQVLVLGGGPLPPQLGGFCEAARAGAWRRLVPCAPPALHAR